MTSSRESPALIGVALTVSDVAVARDFYRRVLDFQDDSNALRLGDFRLVLRQSGSSGRPMPADSRSNDHWFRHLAIVVRDMDVAHRQLVKNGVELISEGPRTLPAWNKDAAGIEALYFRDPDRHPLELIHFPHDKGKPLWNEPGETLFQGVDHTAIVVSRKEESIRFYCDRLGFRVKGTAHNHGAEQEALSAVHAPSVHITTLAGSSSCGIELLEYDSPPDGRPQPAGTSQNDLWWATTQLAWVDRAHEVTTFDYDPDGHGVEWL